MNAALHIVLVGAGNVASHLAPALHAAGHRITAVWSRNLPNAISLADQVQATATNQLNELPAEADLFLVSVADDALPTVANALKRPGCVVAHTSGTQPLAALQGTSEHTGVFYPLQTFTKGRPLELANVPFLIEGPELLTQLAMQLSNNVQHVNSEQRKHLHVAAVFACNFTNHLYAIADKLLANRNLSLDLLRPLIAETAAKAQHAAPATVQTGPAIRHDDAVLAKHLELLADTPQWQELYHLLSHSIQRLD